MQDKDRLAQIRMMYIESRPLHKGAFAVSIFFFLWMLSGLTGLLVIGEPVWMYSGRGTTITRFFPFRVHHVTDVAVEGGNIAIITDFGLAFNEISWITYVLALGFVLSLVVLWLPIIPQVFGSETFRDCAIGLLSLLFFVLLLLSALEDGKAVGYASNFDAQVERYSLIIEEPTPHQFTWPEYAELAGFQGNSDYQLYMTASLLLFFLMVAIFTGSILGMLISSRRQIPRRIESVDPYSRGLRNISLVLMILFAAAAVAIFISLLPFTRNADFLPGIPMFA
ncbi:MAG: hypothetical protein ACXAB4_07870, partial [Candidatus Hodarchaeales archaeon]